MQSNSLLQRLRAIQAQNYDKKSIPKRTSAQQTPSTKSTTPSILRKDIDFRNSTSITSHIAERKSTSPTFEVRNLKSHDIVKRMKNQKKFNTEQSQITKLSLSTNDDETNKKNFQFHLQVQTTKASQPSTTDSQEKQSFFTTPNATLNTVQELEEKNDMLKVKCQMLEQKLQESVKEQENESLNRGQLMTLVNSLEKRVNFLIDENERLRNFVDENNQWKQKYEKLLNEFNQIKNLRQLRYPVYQNTQL